MVSTSSSSTCQVFLYRNKDGSNHNQFLLENRHGKQIIDIPTSFTVDDETLVGEVGVSRMNDLDFALEIRLSIYAELRPPFLPVLSYTVQQSQGYKCWRGKYKYQCHFGNKDPGDMPADPAKNVSRFELHEVAVDDDNTEGLDPKATAVFSLHLGDLFVVADVPALNFSLWYDASNSDAWGT